MLFLSVLLFGCPLPPSETTNDNPKVNVQEIHRSKTVVAPGTQGRNAPEANLLDSSQCGRRNAGVLTVGQGGQPENQVGC